jgi:hypothetical protein
MLLALARKAAGICALVLLLAAAARAQSGTAFLRGTVSDPSGAAVAGAKITAENPLGPPATVISSAQGAYEIRGLEPGDYHVRVSAEGFQEFDSLGIVIAAGQARTLDVSLALQVEKQQVQVSDTAPDLEVTPDKNAGAIALKGSELNALSDDPDQLQQDLEALAGPATGPNGGQMYVNGFTAGQLPPKSSIREIRVNQNPFSSEFDQVGFGRIEILTKPGTDSLHGSGLVWFNNEALNTWSPFVPATITANGHTFNDHPGYYLVIYEGDVSGSLNKKTSFSGSFSHRSVDIPEIGASQDANTFQVTPGALTEKNLRPRTTGGGSIQYQLTPNNTLTVLYQYFGNEDKSDGLSTYSLPDQGYNTNFNEHQVQATDTQIFHDTIVNETRFQYLRDYAEDMPVSTGFSFTVPGYVNGGGNSIGTYTDTQSHYEFQNYTTIAKGKHTIKFGARLRDAAEHNYSLTNGNGSYVFASQDSYLGAQLAVADGQPVPPADYPESFVLAAGYPVARANLFDAGLFVQDDYQWRPNITLSGGMRFETQTGIPDHVDPAPRAAVAYGVGKTKAGAPRTVLRGGWGIFYNRFSETNLLNTIRYNGVNEITYTVNNPNFYPNVPSASALNGIASLPTVFKIAPNLRSPYTMQTAATIEQQLFHGSTLTVNYINARGVHQLYTGNINTPLPGTFDPNNPQAASYPFGYNAGFIDQYQSGGIFKQNQLITSFNAKGGKYLSLYGYYVLNYADGTAGGLLSDDYNPALDYGRTTFDVRNRVFVGGEINAKHGLEASLFEVFSSGQPYNITSGTNLYGTSATAQNSRPSFTTLPVDNLTVFASPWGNLYNGLPAPGEKVIPINLGTGPSQAYANLGLGKMFHFGPKPETPAVTDATRSSSSSATTATTVGRYSIEITMYVRNAFNQVSYATPVGVIGAPYPQSYFLHSLGLAVAGPANRQVYFSAHFNF